MYKLFFDIRKQIIPRLEETDSYKLDFEWKNCDYKEVRKKCSFLMFIDNGK